MQAFLIDPENLLIAAVEYSGNYREIYKHIGADCFDAARFNDKGDAAFIDDNGLLNNPQWFFQIEGYPQPLAGKGLVLGCDQEGESVAPSVTLEWLLDNVTLMKRINGALVGVRAREAMAIMAETRAPSH